MTCQAFKPALNSMEVDAVGWDSDGLGYDTPGDDVDGDEHAEGAALEDLGPLRDKPAAAAAARARGQYGRAAALRKAIAPAANVHVAARRLRDLAGVPLRTVVQFGALGGRSGAPAGRRERLSSVPSSPMNMSTSPVVCMGSEHGGRALVSDSFLSANATLGDDSMDMDDRGVSACALTLEF